MTTRKYSSRSQQTTLSGALTSSGTSATVVSGTSLLGGATITAGETFTVVIDPDTALEEIVDVTAVSTNTLTITRGIDGSSGVAHSAGAVVRHMAIGRDYREANQHIENTTTAHGITLANIVQTGSTGTVTSGMILDGTIVNADINASAAIADTKLATISTASKVSNSATTATSANTNSAIVARDSSGNFSAGTITANLTGTASTATTATTASALSTARNFQLTGDVEASAVSFDGTGNVSLTTVIGTGAIVNADVNASAGITYGKLSLNSSITSADIVDGTIVNGDISASAAIALSKLATDPLARANHTGTQTASTISDFDTQVRTSRLDQMAAPTASVALNAQKITGLADPTSNQDAVTLKYLTDQKGANNGIASLDGSGLIPTNQLPALAITETSVVVSQAAMLALTAQVGDVAVRTDVNKSFILTASPATTLGNWQELLTPTDAVLSVDGNTGAISLSGTYLNRTTGQLLGNLDANNFKVTGLGTPTSNADAATKVYVDTVAGSATAAAASAAAAATTYDNFDDRYLGAKSSAPSVDNDGDALIEGALYWNSVSNQMFAWDGAAWGSISSTAAIFRYKYTAAGGETSESGLDDNGVTLSYLPGKEQVYLNGVLLVRGTDYTASNGTSITSLTALAAGDILEIITFTAFDLATAIDKTLFDAKGDILVATAADTPGKLTAGVDGYVLKANSGTATGLEWAVAADVTLTGTQTLTNKTLTSPTINTATVAGGTIADAIVKGLNEDVNVVASAATGTINFDVSTASVWYYTTDATANHTLNFRYSSGVSLNTFMAVGDSLTVVWLNTNGATPYYPNVINIDGSAVTPKVPAAITSGNASAIDAYSFTIIKTASATFTVLETQTKFA
jgi:hypothetical protein